MTLCDMMGPDSFLIKPSTGGEGGFVLGGDPNNNNQVSVPGWGAISHDKARFKEGFGHALMKALTAAKGDGLSGVTRLVQGGDNPNNVAAS